MTSPVSDRHPAARARGHHLVATARAVAPLVEAVRGPHRAVAMAALTVRGIQGRTQEAFAVAYGIEIEDLKALESGQVAAPLIPSPLLVLTPIAEVLRALEPDQEDSAA